MTVASYSLKGVEIFAAGQHRDGDDPYTLADLDAMVANFRELGPQRLKLLEPPAVIGHEEDQELLDRTDLPAAGWVTKLWRQGSKLVANFSDVPEMVADWIRRKLYRKVSAEIYDEPPEGCPGTGKTLRRVAFLGGEIPQVKSLADLPMPVPQFAAGAGTDGASLTTIKFSASFRRAAGFTRVFSEVIPMDRDTMLAMVKDMGFSTEFLDSLSDEQLALLVKDAVAKQQGGDPAAPAATNAEWPEGMDRAACVAELVGMGEDQAALDAMTDEDLIALYLEKKGAAMADPVRPPVVAAPVAPAAAAPPPAPHGQPAKVTYQFTEAQIKAQVQRMVAIEVGKATASVRKEASQRAAQERKGMIDAFCERMLKEGRVTGADVDVDPKTGKPIGMVRIALHQASAVRKHGEKTSGLDDLMQSIERRDPRYYGERVRVNGGKSGSTSTDDEVAKVRRFAEQDAKFQLALSASGKTPEVYVEEFKKARTKMPALTAQQWGVPSDN